MILLVQVGFVFLRLLIFIVVSGVFTFKESNIQGLKKQKHFGMTLANEISWILIIL